MGVFVFLVLCSLLGSLASTEEVVLEPDRPFLRVRISDVAELECCYRHGSKILTWMKYRSAHSKISAVMLSERVLQYHTESNGRRCGLLKLMMVVQSDIGMYQCFLNDSNVFTHGTYLQVYRPMENTINLSESTKNKILTAEGVLLLLCVVIPSASLLFKSKKQSQLKIKKMKQEEENIYQGLNLDDRCTTYDQIERVQGQSQYQDVCNAMEEMLEKP